ncbi:MAG: DUF177 domain-containing protein [Brevundimonas sp.]|uniref:YceD family protein n=1 Tax=Brevundimonas sp. TaxID=1871086 RepID=UPI0011FD8AD2|nr:DUF177 domain-containing protein [Brevundimonas sp.]RZJ19315.1 MAG: DUF177 domain-containing protein [Brevundimonas sp.]
MSAPAPVFSEQIRLHQIGAGLHRTLEPDQEVRARIAKALDLQALDSFVADLELTPSASGWTLSGRVRAKVVQTCGLTLEPLPATVDQRFSLGLTEAVEPSEDDEIDITMDDESPDPIEDGRIDLGQYAVEQLALALDPFPRKAGATFVQPQEPVEISPFAALKALQDRKPSDES